MHAATSLPSIDVDGAAGSDVVVLDVREQDEWDAGHIEGALHLPMSQLVDRVAELPGDRRIVCVCRSGNRSARVTAWLIANGVDALNLDGGMQRWAASRRPVVTESGGAGHVL
jgi:rhodanese-related sulfurtransferase